MSKRSEAIQAARAMDAQGSSFGEIVAMLQERLELDAHAARGIAAQICQPTPPRVRGPLAPAGGKPFVRHPSVG